MARFRRSRCSEPWICVWSRRTPFPAPRVDRRQRVADHRHSVAVVQPQPTGVCCRSNPTALDDVGDPVHGYAQLGGDPARRVQFWRVSGYARHSDFLSGHHRPGEVREVQRCTLFCPLYCVRNDRCMCSVAPPLHLPLRPFSSPLCRQVLPFITHVVSFLLFDQIAQLIADFGLLRRLFQHRIG